MARNSGTRGACGMCRKREHVTATLRGHDQEVCGLSWSPSGEQLASGGNDNLLHIWAANSQLPLHRLTAHHAAVKALAWCPFQSNLLASGGGTADRTIKFWNSVTGAQLNSIDTHSQVGLSSARREFYQPQQPALLLKCNNNIRRHITT